MLRFVTAGESHGQALVAWISGLPAGVPVDLDFIGRELHRRQLGFGRGGRQRIEKDQADILAGVRHGKTIGAPIALRIENRDWKNWEKALPVEDSDGAEDCAAPSDRSAARARGSCRARRNSIFTMRAIFSNARRRGKRPRAWRRERLQSCCCASSASTVLSHTIAVGHARLERAATWEEIVAVCENLESPLRCVDARVEAKMKAEVDHVLRAGDSVGGIFEVVARGIPPGLGSHAQWDEKLDGAAGARGDVHPSGEGGRNRHGRRERGKLRLRSAGRNSLRRGAQAF